MEGDKVIEIPTDKEFERASRQMRERSRNLDEIRELFKKHFRNECPLYEFYIIPQLDVNFRSYVFFEKNSDIEKCRGEGIFQQIEDFVYEKLETLGRGNRQETTVAFEYDSNENVEANYEGDYFFRMR